MAATTEIITTAEIIDLAIPMKEEFEPRFFEEWILKAQRQYLRPFLGKDFYNEILDDFAASTLSADNQELLDSYLKNMMAHYIVYERLPQINYHVTNSGTVSDFNEFSNPADNTGKGLIRNQMLADAQQFEEQAEQFILDQQDLDSSKFPDFDCGKRNSNKYLIIY